MGPEIQQLFIQIVVPAAFTVLAALITFGGKKLVNLIDAKAKNAAVAGILSRLTSTVQTVMLDVNGTVRADVIAASIDGRITKEEAVQIKTHAIAKVKEHLGVRGLAEIVSVLGVKPATVDSFIGSHLEAAIEGGKAPPSPSDQLLSALPGIVAAVAPRAVGLVDSAISSTGDSTPPAMPVDPR